MGRSKRKTTSPLVKEGSKARKTVEEENAEEVDDANSVTQDESTEDVIADLKEFIRKENAISSKCLAEEIRRINDERMTAVEASLSFALETNETLAKRLIEVEHRAEKAEKELYNSSKRMCAMEEQLDQLQQRDLQDWLIFSGPVIPRRSYADTGEDPARLLYSMIRHFMDYDMDMDQVKEIRREDRQIRVRFNAASVGSDRHWLVRNKTKLRGSGLYIRECLTPFREDIFQRLMQLKRQRQINTVFTRDGNVFIVVTQGDRPRPVRTLAALERVIQVLSEPHGRTRATEHQQPRAGNTRADAPLGTDVAAAPRAWEESSQSQRRDAPGGDGRPERAQAEIPAVETPTRPRGDIYNSEEADGTRATPGGGSGSGGGGRPDPRSVTDGRRQAAADIYNSVEADGIRATPPGGGDGGSGRPDPTPVAGGPRPAVADGRQSFVAGQRPAAAGSQMERRFELRRPTEAVTSTSSVRRRFGGDIRRFVSVRGHSKCD